MAPISLNRLGPPAEDGLAEPTSPEAAAPTTAPPVALHAPGTRIADLSPLKGMNLKELDVSDTPVSGLSPLAGMPLTQLSLRGAKVTDLSPLKGMPLKVLRCDFQRERDVALLRSLTTLEQINDKPAADFWKEVDGQ
ncbi:MAG TPA: hypothetical protein VKD72_23150 [Gemmataceae bacterium]|nr:hypothetical protein [Gemmataceae bacterium]